MGTNVIFMTEHLKLPKKKKMCSLSIKYDCSKINILITSHYMIHSIGSMTLTLTQICISVQIPYFWK